MKGRTGRSEKSAERQGGVVMLVLTRRIGETVVIGHNIRVTVLKIQGSRVKLGVLGPIEIPVHRTEVAQRIMDQDAVETCGKWA
jgi:carbon storage regulator